MTSPHCPRPSKNLSAAETRPRHSICHNTDGNISFIYMELQKDLDSDKCFVVLALYLI
ncbi:hypothetical protein J4Q44_G00347930 [Coregonus suidteri]|uniref:Uncharacterized protein n=1 Tax=Coregonus suidteri TaxID=861788 RepID=A0AAN8KLY2_9TELE